MDYQAPGGRGCYNCEFSTVPSFYMQRSVVRRVGSNRHILCWTQIAAYTLALFILEDFTKAPLFSHHTFHGDLVFYIAHRLSLLNHHFVDQGKRSQRGLTIAFRMQMPT